MIQTEVVGSPCGALYSQSAVEMLEEGILLDLIQKLVLGLEARRDPFVG
jgi:hypothetical protein